MVERMVTAEAPAVTRSPPPRDCTRRYAARRPMDLMTAGVPLGLSQWSWRKGALQPGFAARNENPPVADPRWATAVVASGWLLTSLVGHDIADAPLESAVTRLGWGHPHMVPKRPIFNGRYGVAISARSAASRREVWEAVSVSFRWDAGHPDFCNGLGLLRLQRDRPALCNLKLTPARCNRGWPASNLKETDRLQPSLRLPASGRRWQRRTDS